MRQWRSRASCSSDAVVPVGHVAVSLQGAAPSSSGPRRFAVRVAHLSHLAFLELLRQAEEYGFPAAPGPIALPCDECDSVQLEEWLLCGGFFWWAHTDPCILSLDVYSN
ncbi:uncharacterized protein, partial [Miscanthus floridulus]|uniref:uncharacterized protein n=1 Tax=Miscanthus floridulus TaxID=154761 RepID=UPI0034596387